LTNGLHPGTMIVIAARPGVGKSTLALDFIRSAAIHNDKAAVFFSLEMGKNELVMRLLYAESEIPLQNLRRGELSPHDWTTLAAPAPRITGAPLSVDDSPDTALTEGRPTWRRPKQQHARIMRSLDYPHLLSWGH